MWCVAEDIYIQFNINYNLNFITQYFENLYLVVEIGTFQSIKEIIVIFHLTENDGVPVQAVLSKSVPDLRNRIFEKSGFRSELLNGVVT